MGRMGWGVGRKEKNNRAENLSEGCDDVRSDVVRDVMM